ncbi:MAG: universal stress protein [Gemmatimonadota bacterium]
MKRILVPLDTSPFAERARPAALSLAAASGAQVRLVAVAERQRITEALFWETYTGRLDAYLANVLDRVKEMDPPVEDVSTTLLEGADISDTLLQEARVWGADLIVMTTHGYGGVSRAWLGSVTDALLGDSHVPALVIRPPDDPSADPVVFIPDPIAVTLDGTSFAEHALSPAIEWARLFDSRLLLTHVVAYPAQVSAYLPDTVTDNSDFVAATEGHARSYLGGVEGRLEAAMDHVESKVLVSSTPAHGVLDAVAESGAQLIVTASHGRRGLARWILGGVTDKIIRGGNTPVLVVPVIDSDD